MSGARGAVPLQGVLTMQVTHAGYKDPGGLVFQEIKVLGVQQPPPLVTVSHGNNITILNENDYLYDAVKKVSVARRRRGAAPAYSPNNTSTHMRE